MKRAGAVVAAVAVVLGVGSVAWAQEVSLKVTTVVRAPHPWVSSAQYIKKTLEDKAKGKIRVQIFDGGKLGSDEVTLTSLRDGSVDLYLGGSANAATYIPELSVFNLSFLFKNQAHFNAAVKADGALHQRFQGIVRTRNVGSSACSFDRPWPSFS
jgi:TRAP-type C4-dicarboxylate transport system substrate-binding protein